MHESRLLAGDVQRVSGGLVITGPERTLIDVAGQAQVREEMVEDAMESAFRLGLTTPERLEVWAGSAPVLHGLRLP